MMQSEHTKEFKRDFKKLKKKFRILYTDFDNFKDIQLKLFHNIGIDNQGIVKISGLGIEYPPIYKVSKFACRTLKGTDSKSGIRIIYAYFPDQDKIGFSGINYKGDKENEDRERIERFLG